MVWKWPKPGTYLAASPLDLCTPHGQNVGLFIPAHRDRKADIAAYVEAAKKANALLSEWGATEDEVAAGLDELRRGEREAKWNSWLHGASFSTRIF